MFGQNLHTAAATAFSANMDFHEKIVKYTINEGKESRVCMFGGDIVRPTEKMIQTYNKRAVNPEVEPMWVPMHLSMDKDDGGVWSCRVSAYWSMSKNTFNESCKGIVEYVDDFESLDYANQTRNQERAPFLRIPPTWEPLCDAKKKKMVDFFADAANIRVLRYTFDMNQAYGVGLRYDDAD